MEQPPYTKVGYECAYMSESNHVSILHFPIPLQLAKKVKYVYEPTGPSVPEINQVSLEWSH